MIFCFTLGLLSVVTAYRNVDGSFERPRLAASVFGLVWSFFFLLNAWLLLLHHRYRLVLTADAIRQRGVLRDQQVALADVRRLEWRRVPAGGSARLHGPDGILSIEFGPLAPEARATVMTHLRGGLPAARQHGWDVLQAARNEVAAQQARSGRAGRRSAVLLGLFAALFLALWLAGLGRHFAVFALANAALAGFLLRGGREKESPREPESGV